MKETVQQMAETVGVPAERLLAQMAEAGLPHTAAGEAVSDEDKKKFLAYMQRSRGEDAGASRKITLKRKTISTLKTRGNQGKKTVTVEVRKRRTYTKGDAEAAPEAGAPGAAPQATADAAADAIAEPGREEAQTLVAGDDELKARREARKAKKDKGAATGAAREREQAAGKARRRDDAPRPGDDRYGKKKPGRSERLQEHVRGKQRRHSLSLVEIDAAERGTIHHRARKKRVLKPHEEHSKHRFEKPTEQQVFEVRVGAAISVGELAQRMSIKSAEVIKELAKLDIAADAGQMIEQDAAVLVIEELGHRSKIVREDALEEQLEAALTQSRQSGALEPRAPVVTVMGHVDHGKTSLLDYIRKAKVAAGEAGGITQHIGAYHARTAHGAITFLDTPGHAAFTSMRARGAQSTDIVVLVVAADDGVMPQTIEAIQHARAAKVPLVVAVNKIDMEGADPEQVRKELAKHQVVPEAWGGDAQFVDVSAATGGGIDDLLAAISLQAEILELRAVADAPAQGLVIESRLDKGRGPVASLLVQSGALRQGDIVLAGRRYGRVRAMLDENGRAVARAGPSIPVEILGLDGTPEAGDPFAAVASEKQARELALFRQDKTRSSRLARQPAPAPDNAFENLQAGGGKRALNAIIKADVRGSLEAIQAALADLGNEEVAVNIVASGVGGLTETDAALAMTTQSLLFGFNVRADNAARKLAEEEGLDLRYYNVIYNLIDDAKQALSGMLAPEVRENILGIAEVREVFKSPKFGQIAGCMVTEGAVLRAKPIRVLRENVVIFEGELESLRHFKDDVNEVRSGKECGIGVKNYTDVKAGDQIEVYEVKEVARSL